MRKACFLVAALFTSILCNASNKGVVKMLLGSYGPAEGERIQLYEFNELTGESQKVCGLSGVADASFLTLNPVDNHFYAVSEKDDATASLVAVEVVPSTSSGQVSKMRILNSQPTGGEAPCYVNLEKNGRFAYTANYNGSSLTVFGIDPETGKLNGDREVIRFNGSGPVKERQEKSHIHCVQFTPDSTLLLADDLGMDVIHVFPLNRVGKTASTRLDRQQAYDIKIQPGSGPRHLVFSPTGNYAYLMNELSGMVTVLSYKEGMLTPVQYVLSDSVGAQGSADIHISPDGKFLYASNRLKADGISIFSINPADGIIRKIGYQLTGIHPRNFALTPNGRFLLCACRDDNEIQVFLRNETTGMLKDTGRRIKMEKPVCIKFF